MIPVVAITVFMCLNQSYLWLSNCSLESNGIYIVFFIAIYLCNSAGHTSIYSGTTLIRTALGPK